MRAAVSVAVLLLVSSVVVVSGLWNELLPFGPEEGDVSLPSDRDDVSSPEVTLKVPIWFYGDSYDSIYVNSNGLLSFITEIPSFVNVPFPLNYPTISPFYCDVDTRASGNVFYRETSDPNLLDRVKTEIRRYFSASRDFSPTSLLIATWNDVGYFEAKSDKKNSFQVVVASDGQESFAGFLYPESGLQWSQSEGKNPHLKDARAQVGLTSGRGAWLSVKESGTEQVVHLDKRSNVGVPGLWIFRMGDEVQTPDLGSLTDEDTVESCTSGATYCHSKGSCVDFLPGFCCFCSSGFYGNGRTCLPENEPLRMTGTVNLEINGVSVEDQVLDAYVVTHEGRGYSGISRIPPRLGWSMQLLSVLEDMIGVLFAQPRGGAPNAFELTGGVFNYSAEVHFLSTGDRVYVDAHFPGVDVFDFLKLNLHVRGSIPAVPPGSAVELGEYSDEFTRITRGEMQSKSKRAYKIGSQILEAMVTQRIEFSPCMFGPEVDPRFKTLLLKVSRSFIIYDPQEEIVRYASTQKILPRGTDDDPCKQGEKKCGPNSSCIVIAGDSFDCACNKGFEYVAQGFEAQPQCVDVNECVTNRHNCHPNALCLNMPGGFRCECRNGFTGNGVTCHRLSTCSDLRCAENAMCTAAPGTGKPICVCLPGYEGDGISTCNPPPVQPSPHHRPSDPSRCGSNALQCSSDGICVYKPEIDDYFCICKVGHTGDGLVCIPNADPVYESCRRSNMCSQHATCMYDIPMMQDICVCNPGYLGDGYTCISNSSHSSEPLPLCENGICYCSEHHFYDAETRRCHPEIHDHDLGLINGAVQCILRTDCAMDADCAYDPSIGYQVCRCNQGFVGNGAHCEEMHDVSCDEVNICSLDADCLFQPRSEKYACVCKDGFVGDGKTCTISDYCQSDVDCDQNATCKFDINTVRDRCQCNPGYQGDGLSCKPIPDVGCEIVDNCDRHATCRYDMVTKKYRCICNEGYSGDGASCKLDMLPCVVDSDCGPNAECVNPYPDERSGFSRRCQCSQGFKGDGYDCQAAQSCYVNPAMCHRHAVCVPGPGGLTHSCWCNQGYEGDGFECAETVRPKGEAMFVAQGMSVLKVPLEPTISDSGAPILLDPLQTAVGIDADCVRGKIYYGDISGGSIWSANFNGSDRKVFIEKNVTSPEGVAVDWKSNLIYWTDSVQKSVDVAVLKNGRQKRLVSTELVNPRGIAVHSRRTKIYWSDWNRENPKIEEADQDGGRRRTLIRAQVALPSALAVDLSTDELCWADAGKAHIACLSLQDGASQRIITAAARPFGLSITAGKYFWTDWDTKTIMTASKRDPSSVKALNVPFAKTARLYGVAAVPAVCPSDDVTPCTFENGGCQDYQMCIPSSRGTRKCHCADEPQDGDPPCRPIVDY